MADPIVVVPYDPHWPAAFARLGHTLRQALGATARRIDHIGSTAVPGLDAKPIIDIQISVIDFTPLDAYRTPLHHAGFVWREDNSDLTKRYFREMPGEARTHIHVRRAGSWSEQLALLFRDYLRVHAEAAHAYAQLKYELAARYRDQRELYTQAKKPLIWSILAQADDWCQHTGWQPGPTDA